MKPLLPKYEPMIKPRGEPRPPAQPPNLQYLFALARADFLALRAKQRKAQGINQKPHAKTSRLDRLRVQFKHEMSQLSCENQTQSASPEEQESHAAEAQIKRTNY